MTIKYALLVGTYFNKPAGTLLKCLPDGARVELIGDPDNPYDADAIKVVLEAPHLALRLARLESSEIQEELLGQGWNLEDVLAQSAIMLGHVGASGGKPLMKAGPSAPGPVVGTKDLPEGQRPAFGRLRFFGELVWIELEA